MPKKVKNGIIYKITNLINNKIYIGQTTWSAEYRFKEHSKPRNIVSAINSAIKKYGRDNFKVEVICSATNPCNLTFLENYFIEKYNSYAPIGYNLRKAGPQGALHSTTKAKLSKVLKGRAATGRCAKGWGHYQNKPITARNIKTGVEFSMPSVESAKDLGFCPEVVRMCIKRVRRSKSHKGYFWRYANQPFKDPKIKDVRRRVKGKNIKSKKEKIFNSIKEAAKFINGSHSHISSCCKKRYGRKSVKGWAWEYYD